MQHILFLIILHVCYFQSLHPGYALFLLFGIKDYPRLTFMYLYLFDYYNMFMPFVHRTCSEEDITSSSMLIGVVKPAYYYIDFLVRILMLKFSDICCICITTFQFHIFFHAYASWSQSTDFVTVPYMQTINYT